MSTSIDVDALISRTKNSREDMLAFRKQCIKKHASGDRLTLDETAYAMWNPKVEPKPLTPMGVLKIERKALEKLKLKLKEYGIHNLDDIFDPKHREVAHQENSREW